jgi:hypothetical protein
MTVLSECEYNCFEGSISSSSSVPVKALCVSTPETVSQDVSSDDSKTSSPPTICGGVEERCKMALQHVALGLQCLQYFDGSDKDDCRQQDGVHNKCHFQVLHYITFPRSRISQNKCGVTHKVIQKYVHASSSLKKFTESDNFLNEGWCVGCFGTMNW